MFEIHLNDPQSSNAHCGDKTVICSPRWYVSDVYGLLITVGGVGGDFSHTGHSLSRPALLSLVRALVGKKVDCCNSVLAPVTVHLERRHASRILGEEIIHTTSHRYSANCIG